jgi:hypothetical protein
MVQYIQSRTADAGKMKNKNDPAYKKLVAECAAKEREIVEHLP